MNQTGSIRSAQPANRKTALANLRDVLEKSKSQIAMALPRHMTPERMLRIVLTTVQRNPVLLECSPLSIVGCVVEASQLGLEPDGILGHAYLVPFRNKKTGQRECQLIPGYKGLIDLARRSGQLSTIYAQVVHERDHFQFEYGLEPRLVHRPSLEADPGQVVAVYAVAKLKDGEVQFEVMSRHQVDRIRRRSSSGDSGPWVTDYEEMAKKTVLRRLCKMLPCSVELQKAVALDEIASAGISQQMEQQLVSRVDAAALPSDIQAESQEEQLNENPSIEQLAERFEEPDELPVEEQVAVVEEVPDQQPPAKQESSPGGSVYQVYKQAIDRAQDAAELSVILDRMRDDDRIGNIQKGKLKKLIQQKLGEG